MGEAFTAATGAVAEAPGRAWRGWVGGGVLAVIDQGCFAGANFVLNLLLLRTLEPSAYGTFTAGYAAYLLIAAIHAAVLVEPFTVYAAARWNGSAGAYLRQATRTHWQVVAPLATIAAIVALAWAPAIVAGIAALGLANLYLLLLRAAAYARGRAAWAATASALYAATTIGGAVALLALGRLDPTTAMVAAACGAAVASTWLAMAHARAEPDREPPPDPRVVVAAHARYGRWSLATTLIGWWSANLHYVVLGGAAGLAALGHLRALDILLLPFVQAMTAFGQFAVPRLAARARRGRDLGRACLALGGAAVAGAVLVYAMLVLAACELADLLYQPAIAEAVSPQIQVYAVFIIPYSIAMVAQWGLRARARADLLFAFHLVFAIAFAAACAVGVRHGLAGVAWASVAVQAAMAVLAVALLLIALRSGPTADVGSAP